MSLATTVEELTGIINKMLDNDEQLPYNFSFENYEVVLSKHLNDNIFNRSKPALKNSLKSSKRLPTILSSPLLTILKVFSWLSQLPDNQALLKVDSNPSFSSNPSP